MEKLISSTRCFQDWRQMQERDAGRFCSRCNHCLVDFREKTLEEIANIHSNNSEPVCGIYKLEQVNLNSNHFQGRNPLRQVLAFAVTLFAFASKLEASEQTLQSKGFDNFYRNYPTTAYSTWIKSKGSENIDSTLLRGRISDENGEIVAFAAILVKGYTYGIESDVDGFFELNLKDFLNEKDTVTLVFSYTGYATQEKTYHRGILPLIQEKIVMTLGTQLLEEVIVVGLYYFPAKQSIQSSPLDKIETKILEGGTPYVTTEQVKKYQRRDRLPWHKEFWQKRKQKKSSH